MKTDHSVFVLNLPELQISSALVVFCSVFIFSPLMFSWYIYILIKMQHFHCWMLDDARIFSVLSDHDSQLTLQNLSIQTKYCTRHFLAAQWNLYQYALTVSWVNPSQLSLKNENCLLFCSFQKLDHLTNQYSTQTHLCLLWASHVLQISHSVLPHGLIFVSNCLVQP